MFFIYLPVCVIIILQEDRSLLFVSPQLPPGGGGGLVVFPVIAEKIAAKESPYMIFCLASGFMSVARGVHSAVRQIGAKIKKLKGSQDRRNDPKQDYIFLWKDQF